MASDSGSFDEPPHAFDEIKLPFIYVPHGDPEPAEWIERHPDYIKMPATFIPRARGAGGTNMSFGTPPPGGLRTLDGLAPRPDPGAPWPPAGGAVADAMSAEANDTFDHARVLDDPIAAFLQANHALAMAASGSMSGQANGANLHADAGNDPLNLTDPHPSGLSAGTLGGNADTNYQVIGGGITSRIPGSYQVVQAAGPTGTPGSGQIVPGSSPAVPSPSSTFLGTGIPVTPNQARGITTGIVGGTVILGVYGALTGFEEGAAFGAIAGLPVLGPIGAGLGAIGGGVVGAMLGGGAGMLVGSGFDAVGQGYTR